MAEYSLEVIAAAARAHDAAERDLSTAWSMEDVITLEDAGLMHSRKLTKREIESESHLCYYEPGDRYWEWTRTGLALYRALEGKTGERS